MRNLTSPLSRVTNSDMGFKVFERFEESASVGDPRSSGCQGRSCDIVLRGSGGHAE